MIKLLSPIFLLLIVTGFFPKAAIAQEKTAEVRKFAGALAKAAGKPDCIEKFTVRQKGRRDDSIWYETSYMKGKKVVFRQMFKSSAMSTMVELTPINSGKCGSLFINYSQGASGAYQESYLVFPTSNKFSFLALSVDQMGFFSVDDFNKDGETEIVGQKNESSSNDLCQRFAYWGRIYHLDRNSGRLVEQKGQGYPQYYVKLAANLRNSYQAYKDDLDAGCRNTFLRLIRNAEALAK